MSKSRGNGQNGGHFYSNITQPVKVDLNFVVDSTNANGLGIRSLKSNGYVNSIFMNTASTSMIGTVTSLSLNITSIVSGTSGLTVGMPVQGTGIPTGTKITSILSSSSVAMSQAATGTHASEQITYQAITPDGFASPNPAAGLIMVQFKNNYNYYLGGFNGWVSPTSGSNVLVASAGVVAGTAYIIIVPGTTTTAGWQSLGLPPGITPALGVSFVASATTTATGTGAVRLAGVSSNLTLEAIGDTHLTWNSSIAANGGLWFVGQFLAPTLTSTTIFNNPMIPTAPVDGSVCGMSFFFDASSVTIDGL